MKKHEKRQHAKLKRNEDETEINKRKKKTRIGKLNSTHESIHESPSYVLLKEETRKRQ